MFMSMICKLERVVEEIREAVKEVREHHGKRHRQYMGLSLSAKIFVVVHQKYIGKA